MIARQYKLEARVSGSSHAMGLTRLPFLAYASGYDWPARFSVISIAFNKPRALFNVS
jgi:hypothetical protein